MIMTYDFVFMAQRDARLMQAINNALQSQTDEEVCTNMHKLSFFPSNQTVIVSALSESSPFYWKVIPKAIKYSAMKKLLNGNWNDLCEDEISDIE